MKAKKVNITAKGKAKSDKQKKLDYVKSVRKADREIAIENKTFDTWVVPKKVHVDKKKAANKKASRDFKRNKNQDQ